MAENQKIPVLLWPFWLIWKLVVKVFEMTGRLAGAIIGLVFMIAGVILTVTVVGAIIGVPFITFGLMLVLRSLF